MATALLVGAPVAGAATSSGNKPPPPPKPKIHGVGVSSPTVSTPGGSVQVSATTTNATSCTLSSTPPTPGLPSTVACKSGKATWTVFPAKDLKTKKSAKVKFKVSAFGNGKTAKKGVPKVQVKPGAGGGAFNGVQSITSGDANYCALLNSGGVDCWGIGTGGQLGNGMAVDSSTPVSVEGVGGIGHLNGVRSVASNGSGFCAVLTSGGVDCWGYGVDGELGGGPSEPAGNSSTPVSVVGVGNVGLLGGVQTVVASGPTYCAVLTTGGVDCWGYGAHGELGNGTDSNSPTPVPVKAESDFGSIPLFGVSSIAGLGQGELSSGDSGLTGNGFCAVQSFFGTNFVGCWGFGGDGELGNGTKTNSNIPVEVETSPASELQGTISQVVSDGNGFCAVVNGNVACWGDNFFGELGNGAALSPPPGSSAFAVGVVGNGGSGVLSGVQSLVANVANQSTDGSDGYCARLSSGLTECWGSGLSGQLGSGGSTSRSTPGPVLGSIAPPTFLNPPQSIIGNTASTYTGLGYPSFCAIITANLPTTPGAVACWGSNAQGNLGQGSVGGGSPVAGLVVGVGGSGRLSGAQMLAADGYGYCGLLTTNDVVCWGDGSGAPVAKTMP
jgi:hypothetical protein